MRIGMSLGRYMDPLDRVPDSFDFVEIGFGEHEQPRSDIDTEHLRSVREEKDLGLTVHLPFRQPIATTVPQFNEAVIDYFDELMAFAAEQDAEKAVIHANLRDPESVEELDALHDQIPAIQALGDKHNITPVFENVGHLDTPTLFELGEILADTGAGMCFDTGHAFEETDAEFVADFLGSYADLIQHLHVHDVRRRGDSHILVGEGMVDFGLVANHLNDFDGTACLEVFTDEMDYLELARNKLLAYF